ncbi:MAG: PTS sugar transporter subunit IIA [Phycisphaeraceae bacterium]|nr:PTS sugar transporter subunit IIA [Phycisphaeraceae bacterium]
MKLTDFVAPKAIAPQLEHTDRDGVIAELVDKLVESGSCPKNLRDDVVKAIIDREWKGSTGFGKGVAVPHVKHPKVKKMAAAIGVSQKGVDFNALDKAPVYSVVLLLSPESAPDEHLQAMETIFSHLQKDTFRRFLRQATTTEEVVDLLNETDGQQVQS